MHPLGAPIAASLRPAIPCEPGQPLASAFTVLPRLASQGSVTKTLVYCRLHREQVSTPLNTRRDRPLLQPTSASRPHIYAPLSQSRVHPTLIRLPRDCCDSRRVSCSSSAHPNHDLCTSCFPHEMAVSYPQREPARSKCLGLWASRSALQCLVPSSTGVGYERGRFRAGLLLSGPKRSARLLAAFPSHENGRSWRPRPELRAASV